MEPQTGPNGTNPAKVVQFVPRYYSDIFGSTHLVSTDISSESGFESISTQFIFLRF